MPQIYRTPITRLTDEYTVISVQHNLQTGRTENSLTIPTCHVFLKKDSFILDKLIRCRLTSKICFNLVKPISKFACILLNLHYLIIHKYIDVRCGLTNQAHPQPPGMTLSAKEATMINRNPLRVAGAAAVAVQRIVRPPRLTRQPFYDRPASCCKTQIVRAGTRLRRKERTRCNHRWQSLGSLHHRHGHHCFFREGTPEEIVGAEEIFGVVETGGRDTTSRSEFISGMSEFISGMSAFSAAFFRSLRSSASTALSASFLMFSSPVSLMVSFIIICGGARWSNDSSSHTATEKSPATPDHPKI